MFRMAPRAGIEPDGSKRQQIVRILSSTRLTDCHVLARLSCKPEPLEFSPCGTSGDFIVHRPVIGSPPETTPASARELSSHF